MFGEASPIKIIHVNDLKAALDSESDGWLVDVRTVEEYVHMHAPAVKRVIEHTQLAASLSLLPSDKDTPIYLICRSGNRSGRAARVLMDFGYTEVYNVTGGMLAWLEMGFPTERGRGILDLPA